MHIAFSNLLIERYSPISGGAISTYIYQCASRLIRRGHKVSVLTRRHDDPSYETGEVFSVWVPERHELSLINRLLMRCQSRLGSWDWPYYAPYRRELLKRLNVLKPDVVVAFNDFRTPLDIRVALPESILLLRVSNEVNTRQSSLAALSDAVDLFLPVSTYIKDWLVINHKINPSKCRVLLNGCDLDTFFPSATATEKPLRVLFVGRLIYEKGPDIVVDAVVRLKRLGIAVNLTVVGSTWWHGTPGEDAYHRNLIDRMSLNNITYLGHLDRESIPAVYRDHDVLVVPSRWNEPCGQVQFEGLASGCAVLASKRGGLPESLGDAAVLFDPDNPCEIEQELTRLALSDTYLNEMKARSIAHANRSSWDKNVDILESCINELHLRR